MIRINFTSFRKPVPSCIDSNNFKNNSEIIETKVTEISQRLKDCGYRTHIDNRNIRAGQKYFDWEIKGVPIRLDFGQRDLDSNKIMCTSRIGNKESLASKT